MDGKQITGNVFDVQRFCVHDGPGIRTTVFFKGCPLRCAWCHNPESQKSEPQLAFYAHKCMNCGGCAAVCPQKCHLTDGERHSFHHTSCVACGECTAMCPTDALELLGRQVTVEALMAETVRDRNFYKNSGGGLTVSGGEPLAQPEFLIELLKAAKAEGLHTCIETCGFASEQTVRAVAPYTDLFLFDLKETDESNHRSFTGVPLKPILRSLYLLDSLGAKTVLRCPIIPGYNARDSHAKEIARIADSLKNLQDVEVMAYHTLGRSKYEALGMDDPTSELDAMNETLKSEFLAAINRYRKIN